jgi:hypothetical protein
VRSTSFVHTYVTPSRRIPRSWSARGSLGWPLAAEPARSQVIGRLSGFRAAAAVWWRCRAPPVRRSRRDRTTGTDAVRVCLAESGEGEPKQDHKDANDEYPANPDKRGYSSHVGSLEDYLSDAKSKASVLAS